MQQVLMGRTVVDRDGVTVGKITDVITDPVTLEPEWLTVKTSRIGRERLVPAAAAQHDGDGVAVPFDKEQVRGAPAAKEHTAPTNQERAAIYAHYGMDAPPSGADQLHPAE